MAESDLPFFQSPRPTLRHLILPDSPRRVDAASLPPRRPSYNPVERRQHGEVLIHQIRDIQSELDQLSEARAQANLPREVNLVLEVESSPEFPLSTEDFFQITRGSDIEMLFASTSESIESNQGSKALIHVPYGQLTVLADKINRYAKELTEQGNTPNPWISSIQGISRAALKSLWTDSEPFPEGDDLLWWELWVRRDTAVWAKFESIRSKLQLRQEGGRLELPEHSVVVIQARYSQLESSLDILDTLAELRGARTCHIELSHLSSDEQQEWIKLAAERVQAPSDSAPAVCLLDTGINRGHPLLQHLLSPADNQTIFGDGDPSDSDPGHGHGTCMAGLAAYGDLTQLAMGTGPWNQRHRLEGVKTFDSNRQHEPKNYGSVTVQAVTTPEVNQRQRRRVYAMPITSHGEHDGRPTAWSAAVDACAFGAEEDGEPKRLIFLSAGNADPFSDGYSYPMSNEHCMVQNPAQAWNAVTVGAITYRSIRENDPQSRMLTEVAPVGALSPHSTTSQQWDPHWPIKPDIVMEGGNLGYHPSLGIEQRDSLDMISTSKLISQSPIAPFRATSAATALAARLGAEIMADYPNLRPETVRGLIVHSARWNEQMLGGLDAHRSGTQEQVLKVLRSYGFGEPDVGRARACSQNKVTMIREDELQPYNGSAGSAGVHDCHIHQLRLPVDLLQQLGENTCILRITLSYFVAPNPSASNRIPGSRYRYGSCPLRFRVRHRDETEENFISLVSKEANNSDESEEPDRLSDPAWALGMGIRRKGGSLIQDIWRGSAADLVTMDRIAVFPVKGWWAFRSFRDRNSPWHHCHRRSIRYSLIVSIETMADVPLYNEIQNLLPVPVTT